MVVTSMPLAKPGLEPTFLRGLCFGLAVSAAIWAALGALLVLLT